MCSLVGVIEKRNKASSRTAGSEKIDVHIRKKISQKKKK